MIWFCKWIVDHFDTSAYNMIFKNQVKYHLWYRLSDSGIRVWILSSYDRNVITEMLCLEQVYAMDLEYWITVEIIRED